VATELLSIVEVVESQASKYVTLNTALRHIEGRLVRAISQGLASPPGSPANGDTHILTDNRIIHYFGGSWSYYTPIEGLRLWINSEDIEVVYDGSAWVTLVGIGSDLAGQVKISANDTTAGYLNGKLLGGANITLTEGNDGADETLTIDLDAQPYIFAGTIPDKPADGQTVLLTPIPDGITVTLPAGLTGSKGIAKTAATAQTDFDIKKNGVSVGTMRYAASGTTASFIMASQTVLDGSAGDYLEIIAPATADTTLAKIGFSLKGTR
jgi:hypothetical protein